MNTKERVKRKCIYHKSLSSKDHQPIINLYFIVFINNYFTHKKASDKTKPQLSTSILLCLINYFTHINSFPFCSVRQIRQWIQQSLITNHFKISSIHMCIHSRTVLFGPSCLDQWFRLSSFLIFVMRAEKTAFVNYSLITVRMNTTKSNTFLHTTCLFDFWHQSTT